MVEVAALVVAMDAISRGSSSTVSIPRPETLTPKLLNPKPLVVKTPSHHLKPKTQNLKLHVLKPKPKNPMEISCEAYCWRV